MQQISADVLLAMFFEPKTHLLVGPCPFKGMSVQPIILGFCGAYMGHEFRAAAPRITLQVVKPKGAVQQLRLIEPRCMDRSETRSPPIVTLTEIGFGRSRRVAGVAILNQIHPAEPTMPPSKCSQR